jgi:hypothetical protein
MAFLEFSKSDEWIEGAHSALYLLSTAGHFISLCNEVTIQTFVTLIEQNTPIFNRAHLLI